MLNYQASFRPRQFFIFVLVGRDKRLGLRSLAVHAEIETSPPILFPSSAGPSCGTGTPGIHHLSAKQHDNTIIRSLIASCITTPTSTPSGCASIRPSYPSSIPTSSLSSCFIYQLGAPLDMEHQAVEPPARESSWRRLLFYLLGGSCRARAKMGVGVLSR